MAFVYLLRCSDDTLYCGWTNDLKRRVAAHNKGKASRYTRTRLPVALVYSEEHADQTTAMQREYQIKQLSRSGKKALFSQREKK